MDVFAALADPIRRQILDVLLDGELEAGVIATIFPVSRPAISRHLRILREAGLVIATLDGRRRIYRLQPDPFAEVEAWLATHRQVSTRHPLAGNAVDWAGRLGALETEVYRTRRERRQAASSDVPTDAQPDRHKEQSA